MREWKRWKDEARPRRHPGRLKETRKDLEDGHRNTESLENAGKAVDEASNRKKASMTGNERIEKERQNAGMVAVGKCGVKVK